MVGFFVCLYFCLQLGEMIRSNFIWDFILYFFFIWVLQNHQFMGFFPLTWRVPYQLHLLIGDTVIPPKSSFVMIATGKVSLDFETPSSERSPQLMGQSSSLGSQSHFLSEGAPHMPHFWGKKWTKDDSSSPNPDPTLWEKRLDFFRWRSFWVVEF